MAALQRSPIGSGGIAEAAWLPHFARATTAKLCILQRFIRGKTTKP
jgi:hypothetical protein